jgi:hypothetical protein
MVVRQRGRSLARGERHPTLGVAKERLEVAGGAEYSCVALAIADIRPDAGDWTMSETCGSSPTARTAYRGSAS